MNLERLRDRFGVTVEVEPFDSSATDGGGNPVPGWGDAVAVERAVFDPGSSSEPRDPGANRVVVDPILYLPPGSPAIGSQDRVTVPGESGPFEVEGIPRVWPAGVVVKLKRVDG